MRRGPEWWEVFGVFMLVAALFSAVLGVAFVGWRLHERLDERTESEASPAPDPPPPPAPPPRPTAKKRAAPSAKCVECCFFKPCWFAPVDKSRGFEAACCEPIVKVCKGFEEYADDLKDCPADHARNR